MLRRRSENRLRRHGCLLITILLISLNVRAQELTVTTDSDEARKAFQEGVQLFDNFHFEQARERFDAAIKLDPDFAMAHLLRSFVGTDDADRTAHLGHAVSLASKASEGERLLIEAAQANRQGDLVQEEKLYTDLDKLYPRNPDIQTQIGWMHANRGNTEKGIEHLNRALEADPQYTQALNLLGYAYMDLGDFTKAEDALKRYVNAAPGEANPHDSLADLYARMGQHEKAIEHYREALKTDPTFTMSQRKVGDNLVFLGRYDEARQTYNELVSSANTPMARIEGNMALGRSYAHEGKYDQAREQYNTASEIAKESNMLAEHASIMGQLAMIDLHEGNLDALESRIKGYWDAAEKGEVPSDVRAFVDKDIVATEAILMAKRDDFEGAQNKVEAYRKLANLNNNPNDTKQLHMTLGAIAMEKGDFSEAVTHLKQADQDNPYTVYMLGTAYQKSGDEAQAMQQFEELKNWGMDSLEYALVRSSALKNLEDQGTETTN